ncbi:MAG: Sir2 family NAD-dependent protein deacetylase [Arachnia sp.]
MAQHHGSPDVGGWFRTAQAGREIPRASKGWGPPEDAAFGLQSTALEVAAAAEALRGRPTMILTGAGTSTASGLPDYRGPGAIPRSPMTYQEFVSSDSSRRHYWARSTVGWPSFRVAQPNRVHDLVAHLAATLPVMGVVTQNVDGLHQAAGSEPVLDLHGRLATVSCLACGSGIGREVLQATLLDMNPGVASRLDDLALQAASLPDGDAEVDRTEEFLYPDCPRCGGVLKPDVVYFGENADPAVVTASFDLLDSSDALLVLGTSLSVMSGLRFVRRAARDNKRIIIVNDGATRGDALATHRIHGRLETVLEEFVGSLLNPLPH